jgi:hypothetical protein
MILRHLHAFWNDLWPNAIAPSIWTITAIVVSHVKAKRHREQQHEDLKKHVTQEVAK